MPELHRTDSPSELAVARDTGHPPPDPRRQIEDLKETLALRQLQKSVLLLYRIYDARTKQLLTPDQADDYLARLSDLVHHETGDHLLERYPDPVELKQLFDKDYLGPEAVLKTWGVDLPPDRVPPQPFSDLERKVAHDHDMLLALTVDRTSSGEPLTQQRMAAMLNSRGRTKKRGLLLPDNPSDVSEDFFIQETPPFGWTLISSKILPNSTGKNYLEQLDLLIQEAEMTLFPGGLPKVYQEALIEYQAKRNQISSLLSSDTEQAALALESLKLTRLLRPTPVQLTAILAMDHAVNVRRLLPHHYAWTGRRRGRDLICLGRSEERILNQIGFPAFDRFGYLGCVVVRTS